MSDRYRAQIHVLNGILWALAITLLVLGMPAQPVLAEPPDALTILVKAATRGDLAGMVQQAREMGSTLGYDLNSGWNLSWSRGWYGQMDRLPQVTQQYVAGRQSYAGAGASFSAGWGAYNWPLVQETMRRYAQGAAAGLGSPFAFVPWSAVPPSIYGNPGNTYPW